MHFAENTLECVLLFCFVFLHGKVLVHYPGFAYSDSCTVSYGYCCTEISLKRFFARYSLVSSQGSGSVARTYIIIPTKISPGVLVY